MGWWGSRLPGLTTFETSGVLEPLCLWNCQTDAEFSRFGMCTFAVQEVEEMVVHFA
jgi:hypothetical protein